MSILKKIFARGEETPAANEPAKPIHARTLPSVKWTGVAWNEKEQDRFLDEVLPRHRADAFADIANPSVDHVVAYAMIAELRPTRIMQVGCGRSTIAIRQAMKHHHIPAELIGIDPSPKVDISEAVDAHLDQSMIELPLTDFSMLRGNEMLLLTTSGILADGSDVAYFFRRILPALNPGVILCFQNTNLFTNHENAEAALLQMFLTNNRQAEILYAGEWLGEHRGEKLAAAFSEIASIETQQLWMRLR